MALSKTVKGLTVEIDGKVDGLGKALREVEKYTKSLSSELTDVRKLLKFDPSNVEGLTQKKKLLAESIEACAEKLRIMSNAQERYQQVLGDGNEDEHMRALKREIEFVSQKMREYQKELDGTNTALRRLEGQTDETETDTRQLGEEADEAARDVDELGEEADEAEDDVSALGRAAEKAGDGFTVLKGAASNLLSEAMEELLEVMKELAVYGLQTGMGFEQMMSKVEALIDPSERTAENLDKLTQKAMEMGAKTKFSAGESAEAFTFLAQAGWSTEEMLAGIDGVMSLAATDGIELATAAEITAQAINALGYEAGDATKFADILAVTAAATCTNVEDMGYAFQYVGPVAGALGFKMDDLAVAIGMMADAGINGERAGTSLRSLFTNMAKPTDQMTAAMEKYGISLTDSEGNMKSLSDIMAELRGTFSGLTEAQQTELAATLAGKTGMAGLLSIVNAAPEDFYGMMKAINESTGAADEMAAVMQDNLAGDVEKLGGAFETLSVKITDKFNGAMREGVQAVTEFIDGEISMTEMLDRLKDAVSQAGDVFKGLLPELKQIGGELINYLINGLIDGVPKLMSQATEMVASFCSYIAAAAPNLVTIAGSLLTSFVQGIFDFIPKLIEGAAEIVGSLTKGIQQNTSNFVSKALDLLNGFADKLTAALPKLVEKGMEFIKNMVKGLVQALPDFIARAPEIISKFANLINDNFPTILKKGFEIVWELIKGIIKAIPDLIKNIPKIITAIVDVWEAFDWLKLGKTALTAIGNGFKNLWGWIKGVAKETGDTVVNALKNLPGNLGTLAKNAATKLADNLKNRWQLVKSGSTKLFNAAKEGLSKLGDTLADFGKTAASKLGTALSNGWSMVKNGASTITSKLKEFFSKSPEEMLEIGKNIVKGLWQGIKDTLSWLYDKITDFAGIVVGWFKDLFGIHSPSKVFAEFGKFFDLGLAEGVLDNMDEPIKAVQEMAKGVLGEAEGLNGFTLENNLKQQSAQMAMDVTAKSDHVMQTKLDKILSAIEKGQVLMIDGKQFVGGTVNAYDNALGQRRMLAARGAI